MEVTQLIWMMQLQICLEDGIGLLLRWKTNTPRHLKDIFFNEFNPGVGIIRKLGDTFALGNTTIYATYKESSRNPSVAELGY